MERAKYPAKIYTLLRPPSPEEPYLHPVRHSKIIRCFSEMGNACHSVNTEGSVDFYLQQPFLEEGEDFPVLTEDFTLNIRKLNPKKLEVVYQEESIRGCFIFCLHDPLDYQSLCWLADHEELNIYFINCLDEEYLCSGVKTIEIPEMFRYELQRLLEGRTPLLLPAFGDHKFNVGNLSPAALLEEGTAFYLDYSAMLKRVGSVEDCEEIVSRHILHGLALLQGDKKTVEKGLFLLWVGRKVSLNRENLPTEYYCIYLSVADNVSRLSQDKSVRLITEALRELPEYAGLSRVKPLSEEGVPLAVFYRGQLIRAKLDESFYQTCDQLFRSNFLPHPEYESYYAKIYVCRTAAQANNKISDLTAKREEKNKNPEAPGTIRELSELIELGREEDLPLIMTGLGRLATVEVDDILVTLCEKYRGKLEPYLLSLLQEDEERLRAIAVMGLGIIESKKSIPCLIEELQRSQESATLAKYALALIGETACPYIFPLLTAPRAETRIRGLETLALVGTDLAVTAIKNMPQDRSARVEAIRARILREFQPS